MMNGIYATTLKPHKHFQKDENSNNDSVVKEVTSVSDNSSCDDFLYSLKKCSTLDPFNVPNRQFYGEKVGHFEFSNVSKKVILKPSTSNRGIAVSRRGTAVDTVKNLPSKSIIKAELLKTVLVAKPDFVEFRNFQPNRLYKKIVTLINVSTTPTKFQLEARPNRSKFFIMFTKRDQSVICPGMQVKLIVFFRSEIYDEPAELLVINVQQGKSVIVRLCGRRDPPILRAVSIRQTFKSQSLDFNSSESQDFNAILNQDISQSSEQVVSVIQSISESTSSESSLTCESILTTIFDCGKCFVGEEIVLFVVLKNVGGKGRFFLMSEVDWCSMNVKDFTSTNTIILPMFTIWPAYFALETDEKICLHVSFFPDSYGMHVDKLHVICDNCSVKSTEIIGDGVMFEADVFKFDKRLKKRWPSDINFDGPENYYIHLGTCPPNRKLQNVFSITNRSGLKIHFRWEKRYVQKEETFVDVNIQPSSGYFPPLNVIHFIITAAVANLPSDNYFVVLQLYVEDIPLAAISENQELHIEESKIKRRNCQDSVDVWLSDIEVWLECREKEVDLPVDSISEVISSEDSRELSTTSYEIIDDDPNLRECNQQLTTEELFPSLEVVNINSVTPFFYDDMKTLGTLRPSRSLFVGIEETYTLTLRNTSDQPLTYVWGKPTGSDSTKINIRFYPESDGIPPQSARKIQIILIPLEMGLVRSFHVPCYMGMTRSLMFGIECQIESFYVTFYLPSSKDESSGLRVDFRRVEWHVDSLQNLFNDPAAGDFTTAYAMERLLEEQELMNVDLDEGEPMKEKLTGQSLQEIKKLSINNLQTGEELFLCEDREDSGIITKDILPFNTPTVLSSRQKRVIEFTDLPLMTVQKKTFAISNETSISSSFDLNVRNFSPKDNLCKKSKKRTISEIYKTVMGGQTDGWSEMKRPTSGLLIYVEPKKANLGPYESVYVHVYAFSDTWGIYSDELEVNIVGLPQYLLGICVYVSESPISFPICDKTSLKIPTFRFGTIIAGTGVQYRKVLIRNTSVLPLIINWHKFSVETKTNCVEPPFNILLDIFTPFTNKLAEQLMKTKKNRGDNIFENRMERYESRETFEFLNKFDSISISDSSLSQNSSKEGDDSFFNSSFTSSEYEINSGKYINCEIGQENALEKIKNKEVKISITPYYGKVDTNFCTIHPEEIYIPPKGRDSVVISIDVKKCPASDHDVKIIRKVLGFVRIAPMHKYKDHCYWRQDGYFFPPIEFLVEARIVRPQLFYDICRSDRTFEFNSESVLKAPNNLMKIKKTYLFHNKEEAVMSVSFEATDPFRVRKIVTCSERLTGDFIGIVNINGRKSLEVEVSCVIDSTWVEEMLEYKQCQSTDDKAVIAQGFLLIKHTDRNVQKVELFLKIQYET